MKKTTLFYIVLAVASLLSVGAFLLIGGRYRGDSGLMTLEGTLFGAVYMLMPLISVIITQLVSKEDVLRGIGVRWKINRWWFAGWLLTPVFVALIMVVTNFLPGGEFSWDGMMYGVDAMNETMPQGAELTLGMFLAITVVSGLFAGVTVNALFAFGEEIAWRGFLLKEYEGQPLLKTSLIIGSVWGIWHAPIILMGHNFPQHPVAGVFMMVLFSISYTPILIYVTRKAQSVIVAAIMHGTFNALAGFVTMTVAGGSDLVFGACGLAGVLVFAVISALIITADRKQQVAEH